MVDERHSLLSLAWVFICLVTLVWACYEVVKGLGEMQPVQGPRTNCEHVLCL